MINAQDVADRLKTRPALVEKAADAYLYFAERLHAGFTEAPTWREASVEYHLEQESLGDGPLTHKQARIAYELEQGMYGGMPNPLRSMDPVTWPDQPQGAFVPGLRRKERALRESDLG